MRTRTLTALAVGLALSAGGLRDPNAIAQPVSRNSECVAVNAEIEANNTRAEAMAYEQGAKVVQTPAPGVLGVLEWPLLLTWDFNGGFYAAVSELKARQEYLATVAIQVCPPAPAGPLYR